MRRLYYMPLPALVQLPLTFAFALHIVSPRHSVLYIQKTEQAKLRRKSKFIKMSFRIEGVSYYLLLSLLVGFATSLISDGVLDVQGSTGRSLLQSKKNCPENFEFLNYTIITSQCKGPTYTANECCGVFKKLACPYAEELNDLTNDCATILFSYINLYGHYPPGLFADLCKDGKQGLACLNNGTDTSMNVVEKSGAHIASVYPHFLGLTSGVAVFFFLLL